MLPASLLQAANRTHPQNPTTSIKTKTRMTQKGQHLGAEWNRRPYVFLVTIVQEGLHIWFYTEQSFVDVHLLGRVTPNGDHAPGTMLSSCSQTLTKMQLSPALVHFIEFACVISQKETMTDWWQAPYGKPKQPQDWLSICRLKLRSCLSL